MNPHIARWIQIAIDQSGPKGSAIGEDPWLQLGCEEDRRRILHRTGSIGWF